MVNESLSLSPAPLTKEYLWISSIFKSLVDNCATIELASIFSLKLVVDNDISVGDWFEDESDVSEPALPAIGGMVMAPQVHLTPVNEPRPHLYKGYKQNTYCIKCGRYTFHWHGASPNNPDLYPNHECRDCGFVRKIKIAWSIISTLKKERNFLLD